MCITRWYFQALTLAIVAALGVVGCSEERDVSIAAEPIASNSDGVNRVLCQDFATLPVDYGDSGSPVFFWRWGGVWEVTDVDIMGVVSASNGTHTIYSPWANVITDLGLIASNDPCSSTVKAPVSIYGVSAPPFPGYPATNAIDGSTWTYWSSDYTRPDADEQWIAFDLGSDRPIANVRLLWHPDAWARQYRLQVSKDALTWYDAFHITSGTGGTEDWSVFSSGRYVRMFGEARGTIWGYALLEFEIYTCQ